MGQRPPAVIGEEDHDRHQQHEHDDRAGCQQTEETAVSRGVHWGQRDGNLVERRVDHHVGHCRHEVSLGRSALRPTVPTPAMSAPRTISNEVAGKGPVKARVPPPEPSADAPPFDPVETATPAPDDPGLIAGMGAAALGLSLLFVVIRKGAEKMWGLEKSSWSGPM